MKIKYIIQELYRGNIEVYDNFNDFMWELNKFVTQKVPITISYMQKNDTMTQTKKEAVSDIKL